MRIDKKSGRGANSKWRARIYFSNKKMALSREKQQQLLLQHETFDTDYWAKSNDRFGCCCCCSRLVLVFLIDSKLFFLFRWGKSFFSLVCNHHHHGGSRVYIYEKKKKIPFLIFPPLFVLLFRVTEYLLALPRNGFWLFFSIYPISRRFKPQHSQQPATKTSKWFWLLLCVCCVYVCAGARAL